MAPQIQSLNMYPTSILLNQKDKRYRDAMWIEYLWFTKVYNNKIHIYI